MHLLFFIDICRQPFDKKLFISALEKLNGRHDFSAFTTKQGRDEMNEKKKVPIKNVEINCTLNSAQFLSDFVHEFDEKYEIIEVEVRAQSFLYRMMRKMIGAAVDVARGRILLEQIDKMFDEPSKFYDDNTGTILKPNGLFLKNVEYEDNSFN